MEVDRPGQTRELIFIRVNLGGGRSMLMMSGSIGKMALSCLV